MRNPHYSIIKNKHSLNLPLSISTFLVLDILGLYLHKSQPHSNLEITFVGQEKRPVLHCGTCSLWSIYALKRHWQSYTCKALRFSSWKWLWGLHLESPPGSGRLRHPRCRGWSSHWIQSGAWCECARAERDAQGEGRTSERCRAPSRWAPAPPPGGWRSPRWGEAAPPLPGPSQHKTTS